MYDKIQASRVNCDLANVLEDVVHTNQYSVLDIDSLNDVVADFTTVSNLGELYSGTKRLENAFYDLPIEVREEFNSDLKQFVRGIGTPDFHDKLEKGYERFNGTYHPDLYTSISGSKPLTPVDPFNAVDVANSSNVNVSDGGDE